MRLNVSVSKMAPFGLFAYILSRGKHPLTAMAQEEVCPRDEIADPLGTRMCPSLTNMASLKVSCIFVHRVVCNRRRWDLLGMVGSSVVRSRGRQGEKPCVSYLRRSELSSQVRQRNSYTSYSQGYGKGFPIAPWPKRFVVRWGRRSQCLPIGCASIGTKAGLSRSNAYHSRHTKPSSSPIAGKDVCWS